MIPVKLTMHNFMCYGDNVPPLHFDGIHLACLSGDNGSGKSALIDAMTWAIWGQARAKSDDDLIYSSQTEMEVEFDFRVKDQLYRILRKRSRPKRARGSGQTILEFQMATGNSFRAITSNSVIQTQQKIIDILHMDSDTFRNSAYLRQGHADEFTTKRPAERKEVLAYILGLSFYDQLERQAKELAKQQETEKIQLESNLQGITAELAQKPAYEVELEQSQRELARIEEVIKEKESGLTALRKEKETLVKKKVELEQLEARARDTETNLQYWAEQVNQHRSRLTEYEELLSQRPTIDEGYTRFQEAKNLSDELNQKLGILVKLREHRNQLMQTIDRTQSTLVTEHTLAQSKLKDLETKSGKLPGLKNQLQQIQDQLRHMIEQDEILHRKKQAGQELQTQVNYLESNQIRLEREISEIREKLSLLSTQTEATCPLCETELGIEGLKLVESKYTTDEQSKSDSLKSSQSELARKKIGFETLKTEVAQLESRLNQERATAQGKVSIIEKEIAEAEAAAAQSSEERNILAEIEQRLAAKKFAIAEQEALSKLEDELAELGYDAEKHEEVRLSLTGLEQYDHSKRKLEEAERLIGQEREATSSAEEVVQKLRHGLETDKQRRQDLTAELASFPNLLDNLAQAETESQDLARQRSQAQEMLGGVKTKLQRCAEFETKKREKTDLLAQASKQESIYKELAQAFGKGGVQAWLIEMALPEIEVEANRLLARMTDNRMHVKFETQRETKTGNVIETLDINISDELGTRNYEMFSGGEAFRIDFAIRIALSKLLAKRAGAPLPTLIIDEGFGTQDSTGLEKLKEAINSIQDDFDKIIVITHIEELRDAFPTRIDVVKTAEGSTISVN